MRALLFTLMWLACATALPATVYKWVDKNGVTHYSDQPHPGAQKVQVESVPTYTPPPLPQTPSEAGAQREAAREPLYQRCDVYAPSNDEVLFNTSTVTVRVGVEPDLRAGHRIVIVLDGRRVTGLPETGSEFTISPVYRGTHSLMVGVETARGEVVCQSSAITFHVRQPSVQAPNPANRPRF